MGVAMSHRKPAVRDLSAAGIVRACTAFVPVNAPIHIAIAAHRLATMKPLRCATERAIARNALRAVILASTVDVPEMQRQYDYLNSLPPDAWDGTPPQAQEKTLAGITRSIHMLQLN